MKNEISSLFDLLPVYFLQISMETSMSKRSFKHVHVFMCV